MIALIDGLIGQLRPRAPGGVSRRADALKKMGRNVVSVVALGVALAACKGGVKAGDPCGSGCDAPAGQPHLTCITTSGKDVCGASCDFDSTMGSPTFGKNVCKDPSLAPGDVTVNGLAAGCYCLPK